MKKIRILRNVLKRTHANKFIAAFLIVFFAIGLILMFVEPEMHKNYGRSLYYCFMIASSVGNGDIIVTTDIARVLSVILSIYSIFAIALITGVIVSYYTAYTQTQFEDSVENFFDKLERLPELSKEELEELSEQVIQRRERLKTKKHKKLNK